MGTIKTKEEIEKLRNAAILGDKCFEHICGFIKVGMTEIEIAHEMDVFFMKNGATALSFDTIVGAGKNSALIHSVPSDNKIKEKDIILLDFGCVLDGYCSDTSRTIFVGGVTDKELEIYRLVKEAHDYAVKNVKVQMLAKEIDELGRKSIQEAGYDYAHALGHGVGTEVHEQPTISPRNDVVVSSGTVFTIEPGIYLEGEFGVRIEDTGLLTEAGFESFSNASREIIIL
ncbi:MAG: aminopeptidase P family protein [Clostridia bacterium]|nr:aminopeptidase P family protein [Clostridia bacterium]